jgi:hypothetical protein
VENTNKFNLKDYIGKLHKLSEQAHADGKEYVCGFIELLLHHRPLNIDLYEYIYTTADDLTEKVIKVYQELLQKNMSVEWYELVSFIADERSDADKYYPFILNCMEVGCQVDDLRNILSESRNLSEFEEAIERVTFPETEAADNAFMEHLKNENATLNKRLDSVLEELNVSRQELKKMMEESFTSRQRTLKYKLEIDHLQEKSGTSELSVKLAESKILQYKAMLEQQNKINEQLRVSLKESTAQLEKKSAEVAEQEEKYIKQIGELEGRLQEKEQDVLYYQSLAEKPEVPEHYPERFQDNETETFYMDDSFDMSSLLENEGYDNSADTGFLDDESIVKEENDYSDDDLISIQDNRKEIAKHSNLLATLIAKHQDRCFQKKTLAEQENLVFMKMLEKNMPKDMVQMIRNTMKNNGKFSRLELYKLVARGAGNEELSDFCKMAAVIDGV